MVWPPSDGSAVGGGRPGSRLQEEHALSAANACARPARRRSPHSHPTALFLSPLVSEKVLAKLFAERGELVRRTVGTRVGTNAPTDLFNLMSEHLKIAREGGSYTLQRRLLSAVMGEVVRADLFCGGFRERRS